MANIRLIKGRIKSAKNIAQITKAMELVAASKMRKAQVAALAGKLYAGKIYEMVMQLSSRTDAANHPLLLKSTNLTGKRLVIFITTNKGLCGGLNTQLFRWFLREQNLNNPNNSFIVLGKKGAEFLVTNGNQVGADFSTTIPFERNVPALTDLIVKEFLAGRIDGVDLVFNEFINILKQSPRKKTILPLTIDTLPVNNQEKLNFLIEPSIKEVFDSLLPHYVENQIRDAVLQAEASEHSARMLAMRNATDNALNFMQELTLIYNKARQEKITYEISDMVTARLAVE